MIEVKLVLKSAYPAQIELLRVILMRLGISDQELVENTQKSKTYLSFFLQSKAKTDKILKKIRALKLKGFSIRISTLEDRDWKTRWKKYVKPFKITKRLRIVPLWKKRPDTKSNNDDVYIDTTCAFGTGLHATTKMMARLMELKKGNFLSFFDVGTGSGILTVIAAKYGAAELYAIDMDKVSVLTARRNFSINHCRVNCFKAVSFDNFDIRRQFDFVAANLISEDLIRVKDKLALCVKPGKYMAVSGIYQDNYEAFRRRFKSRFLKCLRILKQNHWYSFLFMRKA